MRNVALGDRMIDLPVPVRSHDGDAMGHPNAMLPDAAVVQFAQEVITRLARWASETATDRPRSDVQRVRPDVPALCHALVGVDPDAARRMIRQAHDQGATHAELCLYHVGAAALRLGVLRDGGRISSADTRLAGARMLILLRDLRELAPPFEPRRGRCALFATVPGEDHVLGVTMAADLFRDEGWDVHLRLDMTESQLVELVEQTRYPIVGLSAGSVSRLPALAHCIVALRVAAPKTQIFVSGHLARHDRRLAARVGADGAAWKMDDCMAELDRLHDALPGLTPH
jgi:methanogenic corrinoid protein MtbC1